MHKEKCSYIKDFMGSDNYEEFKGYAKGCIPLATIVLVVVITLTYFFHWGILSWILNLITGTSLIFIAYIIGVVLLLDFGVDVDMEQNWDDSYSMQKIKPKGYNITKVWGIVLIILAIASIYFSNKYRKHYAFECETYLVDENSGIFHLSNGNDEENMEYTTKMTGYEIEEKGYSFCESCKEWLEDMEMEAEAERYSRR